MLERVRRIRAQEEAAERIVEDKKTQAEFEESEAKRLERKRIDAIQSHFEASPAFPILREIVESDELKEILTALLMHLIKICHFRENNPDSKLIKVVPHPPNFRLKYEETQDGIYCLIRVEFSCTEIRRKWGIFGQMIKKLHNLPMFGIPKSIDQVLPIVIRVSCCHDDKIAIERVIIQINYWQENLYATENLEKVDSLNQLLDELTRQLMRAGVL